MNENKKQIKNFWKQIVNKQSDKTKKDNQIEYKEIVNYKSKHKPLIEIKNLSMTYKKALSKKTNNIFNDLNFTIFESEVLALIGSNGVGKTTIVDIIAGIKQPTGGQIIFNYESSCTNKIGVQFQDLSFPKGLSVQDMLDFELQLNKNIDINEFNEMLETFRLKELLKTNIAKLSGGQQQRLNVIISLMNKPKVVFLDEFTTGLDIAIKNEIKNFIVAYCKKYKITIVLISHDVDIIDELVDHFIVIANKQIIVDSSRSFIMKKFKKISNFLNAYIN